MSTRPYRKQARARSEEATRRRIVEAAVDLHGSVGPARTTVAEIARRAGVSRLTVYNHFPDDAALLGACSGHWIERHPPPDAGAWAAIGDPRRRLRVALEELYAWYAANEAMLANSARDAQLLPALAELHEQTFRPQQQAMVELLAAGRPGADDEEDRALLTLGVAFETWRTLARAGLAPERAAAAMASAVDS